MPAHESDLRFLVLHGVRVAGFVETDALAGRLDRPADEVGPQLVALADEALVVHRDGRVGGWTPTAQGRAVDADLASAELDATGRRAAVHGAYRRFLDLNEPMLGICTDWQLRTVDGEHVANDHADGDHDAEVIARLADLDDGVAAVCDDLAGSLARFAPYRARLSSARSRVEAGDGAWFAAPLIDSYHTVWSELHEDLLVTLGIERGKE